MNKPYLKGLTTCLSFFLFFSSTLFLNSCKKDSNLNNSPTNTPAVNVAKAWYEKEYPINKSNSLKTQAVGTAGSDFSQFMKPDWNRPASYKRFNKDVIEMPLDPSVSAAFTLKNINANKLRYKKEYSRSSFLLLKDEDGYKAYIMTIIADSAYLKNDLSKLANNTYSKRDADFSGLVLYFTPKGKFVSGWGYKNGQITQPSSQSASAGSTKVQSLNNNTLKPFEIECIDWYLVEYQNGVEVNQYYLYTTCDGTAGGTGTGSGSGSGAPPNPCNPAGPNNNAVKGGNISINSTPPPPDPVITPGDGGGFPPPDPVPCSVPKPPGIFGLNNSNAVVPDANFDALLAYAETQGLHFDNPVDGIFRYNGVDYPGQFTNIYDHNNNPVAQYFSPNSSDGPFQSNNEYNVGVGGTTGSNPGGTGTGDIGAGEVFGGTQYPGGTISYSPSGGSGGSSVGQPLSQDALGQNLIQELNNNPQLLIDCFTAAKFKSLVSFKPPQFVLNRLNDLNNSFSNATLFQNQYFVQQIQNASGSLINLDRFEINVSSLPIVNGARLTAAQFLEYIRLNINNFVDNNVATFFPYVDVDNNVAETYKWISDHPVGSILHLHMDDDGAVVVGEYTPDHFTVSTIRTPLDGVHPVSGNRSWGFVASGMSSYTFYVTGADRLTTSYHNLFQLIFGVPFTKADDLWQSYQTKVASFVNSHGGSANVISTPTKERPDYQALADYFNGKITLQQLKSLKGCD